MHALGSGGMMRRLYDPTEYPHLEPLQPTNEFISYAAFALFVAQLLFAFNFIWSLFRGRKAEQNPWLANSLEWTAAPSPPPHGNFAATPTVYRGPYEYSSPETPDRDWYPQNELPPVVGAGTHATPTEVRR
jgi:cytochrome c oxidase subunit 1